MDSLTWSRPNSWFEVAENGRSRKVQTIRPTLSVVLLANGTKILVVYSIIDCTSNAALLDSSGHEIRRVDIDDLGWSVVSTFRGFIEAYKVEGDLRIVFGTTRGDFSATIDEDSFVLSDVRRAW